MSTSQFDRLDGRSRSEINNDSEWLSGTQDGGQNSRLSHTPPRFPRSVRDRVLVWMAWGMAGSSIILWLLSPAFSANSDGRWLINLGIVSGLAASCLILWMLILAARVPLIDRTFGQDRALAAHSRLGRPAFYLLLAHGIFLALGYSVDSSVSVWSMTKSLLGTPDVLLASVSTAGITIVIVTSIVAVRKALPYEGWHLIHMLMYAAILVSVPHQFSQGNVFGVGSWQRWFWVTLYALAFGSLVAFRFLRPIVFSLRHRMVVAGVQQIAPDAVSLYISGRHLQSLTTRGGQFFIWRFWASGLWWQAHPFSVSAVINPAGSDPSLIRVTVRRVGSGSRAIGRLRVGTPVSCEGPYGAFTTASRTKDFVAIAAAGIGITPIRSFIEELHLPAGNVTILLRATSDSQSYLWDEVSEWARRNGHQVYVSVGSRSSGDSSWLSAQDSARGVSAATVFPHLANTDLFICGRERWAESVARDALSAGADVNSLHRESFAW